MPHRLRLYGREIRSDARSAHMCGHPERLLEQERLEQRDSHRVDVALDLVSDELEEPLGRHVHRGSRTVTHLVSCRDVQIAPEAEVTDVNAGRVPVLEQQVRRLDVTVDDPLLVGPGEGRRRLGKRPGDRTKVLRLIHAHERMKALRLRPGKISEPPLDHVAKRRTFDERHRHAVKSFEHAQLLRCQQ